MMPSASPWTGRAISITKTSANELRRRSAANSELGMFKESKVSQAHSDCVPGTAVV